MKKSSLKRLAYALVPSIMGMGLVGINFASAHGMFGGFGNATPEEMATRQQTMFQHQADMMGLSVDEIKSAWAEGKTMSELAKEKGISEETLKAKMKEMHLNKMKEQLQTLVSKGIITQAQADKRLQAMQKVQTKKGVRMNHGFHMGWGL